MDDIGLIISIASALIAVVGAAISIQGSRLARRDLRAGTYQAMNQLAVDCDRVFIEYPLLYPFFFEGQGLPTADPDRAQVLAACAFTLDTLDGIWDHGAELDAADRESWCEWIHGTFEAAPAMQAYYRSHLPAYATLHGMFTEFACSHPDQHRFAATAGSPHGPASR
jgi:hypothetical protein